MSAEVKLRKEQQRNLKHQIGETAADAVVGVRQIADRLSLEHKVLAAQMLDFERTIATVKESRARDLKRIEALEEQLENVWLRLTDLRGKQLDLSNDIAADMMKLEARVIWLERPWWRKFMDGLRREDYSRLGDTR